MARKGLSDLEFIPLVSFRRVKGLTNMGSGSCCTFKQPGLPHTASVWSDALSTAVRDLNKANKRQKKEG